MNGYALCTQRYVPKHSNNREPNTTLFIGSAALQREETVKNPGEIHHPKQIAGKVCLQLESPVSKTAYTGLELTAATFVWSSWIFCSVVAW